MICVLFVSISKDVEEELILCLGHILMSKAEFQQSGFWEATTFLYDCCVGCLLM